MFSQHLKKALQSSVFEPDLHQVMDYAVFPAGKLFRPSLVLALAKDINHQIEKYHQHLAAALELHHAYTLVHDDLPPMDNDLIRRGRPSTFAQFGEWKAILAGDALLVASFHELMKMNHKYATEVHHLFTWATGAKGLILGQFMDLRAEGKMSFSEIVRVHELKTARLIQVATLGTYLLSSSHPNLRGKIQFLRLGREIGLSFQLLDDLSELAAQEISEHEKDINPFLKFPGLALLELHRSVKKIQFIIQKNHLHHVESILNEYFNKNQKVLMENFSNIEKSISDKKILPDMWNWITTFV